MGNHACTESAPLWLMTVTRINDYFWRTKECVGRVDLTDGGRGKSYIVALLRTPSVYEFDVAHATLDLVSAGGLREIYGERVFSGKYVVLRVPEGRNINAEELALEQAFSAGYLDNCNGIYYWLPDGMRWANVL